MEQPPPHSRYEREAGRDMRPRPAMLAAQRVPIGVRRRVRGVVTLSSPCRAEAHQVRLDRPMRRNLVLCWKSAARRPP